MPKPPSPVGGRANTARELKAVGMKLATLAMGLRRPLVLAVDSRLKDAVNALHKASQELYGISVGVELGHVQLAMVEPEDYSIDPVINGRRLPNSVQVRMCGNSVSPPVAEALVRANLSVAGHVDDGVAAQ